MTNVAPDNELVPDIPYKVRRDGRWVWRCSDASIAADCPSVLALVEVAFAVCFYGWLAQHSGWPWIVFVGLVAAPFLLLRSPESAELGVSMLGQYWVTGQREGIPQRNRWISNTILVIVTGLFSYWLAPTLLPPLLSNSALFLRGALFSVLAFAFGYAISEMVKVAINGVSTSTVVITKIPLLILTAPAFALGILLRGTLIRWFAALRHLPSGMRRIPHNWRETLLATDLCHPPELLPGASQVAVALTAKGIWQASWHDNRRRVTFSALIVAWYAPALAYRWSLKASAWLWWPLSLALASPLEGLDGKAVREQAAINVSGAWNWLMLAVPLTALAWMLTLAPQFATVLHLLPEWAGKLAGMLPAPPPASVRFVALVLLCALALVSRWRILNLKATHGKVLESPKELNDLSEDGKKRFRELAEPIERLRWLMIVTVLCFGEASAAAFFHSVNPQEAQNLIAPWLLPIL